MDSGPRKNSAIVWEMNKTGLRVFMLLFFSILFSMGTAWAAPETILVSAEGLADPNAETYQRDKGLLLDALREDARRQVVEKAVGTFVESATLVENYELINDRVLTKSKGLIKRVVKESDPWLGEDGFMHLLLKAEVFLTDVREAVKSMSRAERINLIKEHGNPRIAVSVTVKDAERGTRVPAERSAIAENLLKERISGFGYRVWSGSESESAKEGSGKEDFFISGEAKFKPLSVKLKASGIKLKKYVLTSWTVKCVATDTGEEIYFNSRVPKAKSWSDEDAALEDIGRLIGEEFNRGFFENHLMKPSRIFQLSVDNLPDYDTGVLLKKELIGLRPVLNVDLRSFDAKGASVYEVEFSGSKGNFVQIVNDTVVKPLNRKLQTKAFRLLSARGDAVALEFSVKGETEEIVRKFKSMPPASLSNAPAGRLEQVIKDETMLKKVAEINPDAAGKIGEPKGEPESKGVSTVEEF
jgi:serine/threonine-protein kinase